MQIQVIRLFLGDTIFVLVAWLSVCRAKHSLWPGLLTHLERFTITFSCAGNVLERGLGFNTHGSPLTAIGHLISVIAKQPFGPIFALGAIS